MPYTDQLKVLADKELYRTLRVKDEELIDFSSNDYLGMSNDPDVIEVADVALNIYGLSQTSSRLISGTTPAHQVLELELAQARGRQGALVFSSGYLANLGVIGTLVSASHTIFLDKLCHASLIDASRLSGARLRVFPHADVNHLQKQLEKEAVRGGALWIVTDTVFSMDGDHAPLLELYDLAIHYGATLIVDEAHALGVLGNTGMGLVEHLHLPTKQLIEIGTLSKALGGIGGFVAGDADMIDYLINTSRPFIYDTAIPRHIVAGVSVALRKVQAGRVRAELWENIRYLASRVSEQKYPVLNPGQSAIFPFLVGEEAVTMALSKELAEKGLAVPAIRYPTVKKGQARLRVSVTSRHTKEDIDELIEGNKSSIY